MVSLVLRGGFVAVALPVEVAKASVTAGFFVTDGGYLRVAKLLARKGSYPDPRGCRCCIRLVGLPLVFYDKVGVSLIVRKFDEVELSLAKVWPKGEL